MKPCSPKTHLHFVANLSFLHLQLFFTVSGTMKCLKLLVSGWLGSFGGNFTSHENILAQQSESIPAWCGPTKTLSSCSWSNDLGASLLMLKIHSPPMPMVRFLILSLLCVETLHETSVIQTSFFDKSTFNCCHPQLTWAYQHNSPPIMD